jgi:hypothetical protein
MPRLRPPSPSLAIAIAALFVALGGPAQAAKLIDGGDIRKGTVASKQVKDRSLKARDLSRRAVRTLKATPARSVTGEALADRAVTTRTIAPGSVLTGSVGDDTLTAADLAPNSAGPDEVADNAVGQTEIRNNGVGPSEIADQSVDTGEVIDGGLTVRDVARFSGSLLVNFSGLTGGACQPASVTDTPMDRANADISSDLIVVSPSKDWPTQLVYGVAGSAVADQFVIYACNPSRSTAVVDPPSVSFRYAVLGF